MAYVLGLWRLSSDLGLTGEFALEGAFSHWQLWMGLGATAQISAFVLHRYGTGGTLNWPKVFSVRFGHEQPEPIEEPLKSSSAAAGR
jgi:hypothetical protein